MIWGKGWLKKEDREEWGERNNKENQMLVKNLTMFYKYVNFLGAWFLTAFLRVGSETCNISEFNTVK